MLTVYVCKVLIQQSSELRIVKGPDEIDALRTAIRLSEEALRMTLEVVGPGSTEREIANRLVAFLAPPFRPARHRRSPGQ